MEIHSLKTALYSEETKSIQQAQKQQVKSSPENPTEEGKTDYMQILDIDPAESVDSNPKDGGSNTDSFTEISYPDMNVSGNLGTVRSAPQRLESPGNDGNDSTDDFLHITDKYLLVKQVRLIDKKVDKKCYHFYSCSNNFKNLKIVSHSLMLM